MIFLASCSKNTGPDSDNEGPFLVVEGWITTQPTGNYIKLSMSVPYLSSSITPVSNANVLVEADHRMSFSFQEDESIKGLYLPGEDFHVVSGSSYLLHIMLEEEIHGKKHYWAESKAISINPVDSIKLKYHQNWGEKGFYEVKCFYQDPPAENHYLCNILINGRLVTDTLDEKIVVNDKLFNGNYTYGIGAGFLNQSKEDEIIKDGDTVHFELAGVSREFAQLVWAYQQVSFPENPFFGGGSSTVRGNISDGAIGYFVACQIESSKTIK
jgi:hypothetical protein